MFWTAGQRVDPTTESTFVWRVKSAGTGSDKVSVMTYTNWIQGQPDYSGHQEECMFFSSSFSYKWNDSPCSFLSCPVCEI